MKKSPTPTLVPNTEIQCVECGVLFSKPYQAGHPPDRCEKCRTPTKLRHPEKPKDANANQLKRLATAHTDRCIKRLAELVDHEDGNIALKAINSLLDRAYGKAPQSIQGEDGGPVKVMLMSFREYTAERQNEEDG